MARLAMRLAISHHTVYRYARPVTLLPHRMMLCPRGQLDLHILSARLTCTPPAEIEWTQDVFGNLIATASFSDAVEMLAIDSRVVVDQSAPAWPVFNILPSAHDFPFAYSAQEVADLGALREPQYRDAVNSVADWVERFRSTQPTDTLTLLQLINAAIIEQFSYSMRDAEGTQSPDETIHTGQGACRDFATLYLEAVRHLGFGARAVSGYLHPDAEAGTVADHQATHAWAEVYLPGAGWIAFDPTHARMGGNGLIPVAVARGIDQIKPVEGHFAGSRDDFIDMRVEVRVSSGDVLTTNAGQPEKFLS